MIRIQRLFVGALFRCVVVTSTYGRASTAEQAYWHSKGRWCYRYRWGCEGYSDTDTAVSDSLQYGLLTTSIHNVSPSSMSGAAADHSSLKCAEWLSFRGGLKVESLKNISCRSRWSLPGAKCKYRLMRARVLVREFEVLRLESTSRSKLSKLNIQYSLLID